MRAMTQAIISKIAVRSIIKYDRLFFFVGMPIGLLFGIVPLILSFNPALVNAVDSAPDSPSKMRIFGLGFLGLALFAIVEHLVKKKKDFNLLNALSRNMNNIVWVYKTISKGSIRRKNGAGRAKLPMTFYQIFFGFSDGTKHSISVNEDQADSIVAFMAENYSKITTGYSEEAARTFKSQPSLLKNVSVDPGQADIRTSSVSY